MMILKRNRLILYVFYGVLHLFILGFSIYIDMDGHIEEVPIAVLLQLIEMLKYGATLLIFLIVLIVILHVRDNVRNERSKKEKERTISELKAKIYDLEKQPNIPDNAND